MWNLAEVTALLVDAYAQRHKLLTGKAPVEVGQNNGVGSAKVVYHATDLARLDAYIIELNMARDLLSGSRHNRRRAFGIV